MACPACEDKFQIYGYKIDVGGIYYTSTEKACCPVKVIVTSFNHLVVNFKTKDGLEHSKNFNDFMKSSWVDRSV
jgi:hypothetical protein